MKLIKKESRHYNQIWEKVILKELDTVFDECDAEFRIQCNLKKRNLNDGVWKSELEDKYRSLRRELKLICYRNKTDDGYLDGRKLAAVFCKALMQRKPFIFDTEKAYTLMEKKKKKLEPIEFNRWVVDNIYLNYKLAYYVSLHSIYLTLLNNLLENNVEIAKRLNEEGHLFPYPHEENVDSFTVNMIIGLARSEFDDSGFDMFLFAMQLYQHEIYTVEKIKRLIENEARYGQ